MSALKELALTSPIDLSIAEIKQDGSMLIVTSQRTSTIMVLIFVTACVSLWFFYRCFKKSDIPQIFAVLTNILPAMVFGIIALVMAFGSQQKAINLNDRKAITSAGLGPVHWEKEVMLPSTGTVTVSYTKEQPTKMSKGNVIRHYNIHVQNCPELSFTVPNNRSKALEFAHLICEKLGYTLNNFVEDDGVERIKQNEDVLGEQQHL